MKEYDFVIIGGGCAGLSLAYDLKFIINLMKKHLAIVEPRSEYKRDKTWSFWKVNSHNFKIVLKKVGKVLIKLILKQKLSNASISISKV